MTNKKLVMMSLTFSFLIISFLIIYAKANFKSIDYDDYIKNSTYNFFDTKDTKTSVYNDMNYEDMYSLDNYFIDNEIESLNDLYILSDYILIIKNNEIPTFKGNGLINNCIVKKVIKGHDIKENEKIKIYDLISFWAISGTFYLGGSTPLKQGNEYIVFLKKPIYSNMPEAFVFTSVKYGHISTLTEIGILENYEQGSLSIEEISNYDFVFSRNSNENEIEKYKKINSQIRELLND
ncbi:MAG: hypothetical protein PHC65_06085 [Methanobacteriaceae archaeon]|nr:hypothetical protein [Methanobacteriaceae archaeon]MDD3408476.1 hypothetical protein [Methanobacteriaceae archaeon]